MPKQPQRTTKSVAITAIVPSRLFTRSAGGEAFTELVRSITRTGGPIQTPVVRPLGGTRYEIIAGCQRWLAAKEAGQQTLRVDIVTLDDREAALWMLTENAVRSDLTAMDEAELYWAVAHRLNETEPPPSGGPTPHHLSARRAAALLAKHVGKAADTIRKVLACLPSTRDHRQRLRQVGATVEHIRQAQRIVSRFCSYSDEMEKFWVDLVCEGVIKGWSVRDLGEEGRQKYRELQPAFFPEIEQAAFAQTRLAQHRRAKDQLPEEPLHRCPHCGFEWQGACVPPRADLPTATEAGPGPGTLCQAR